jgi:hypothetical protein
MLIDLVLFVLRLAVTAAICVFVWTAIPPRTQPLRIMRAAVLVCCLLVVLLVLRSASIR